MFPYIQSQDLRVIPIFAPGEGMSVKECVEVCDYAPRKAEWKIA